MLGFDLKKIFIISLSGIISLLVFAEAIQEYRMYSVANLLSDNEIKFSGRLDEYIDYDREIASYHRDLPKIKPIKKEKIVVFENPFVKAQAPLVKKTKKLKKVVKISKQKKNPVIRGIRFRDGDFVLERAVGPVNLKNKRLSHKMFVGEEEAEGEMALQAGSISELRISLTGEDSRQLYELDLNNVQINNGGQFSAYDSSNGEKISGILTNNGKTGFKIRVANGALKGAILNFVTTIEYDRLAQLKEDQAYLKEEAKFAAEERKQEALEKQAYNEERRAEVAKYGSDNIDADGYQF